ncbi:MAG: hypothetical protein ABSA21_10280 [Candidatus Limnocylindrales bacterium]|jgi:hypothetical protein
MVSHSYYDRGPETPVQCRHCGWDGPFSALKAALFSEVIEYDCPACYEIVLVLSLPTYDDVRAAAAAGNQRAIADLPNAERVEQAQAAMRATMLRSASDLPELLLGRPTLFVWDQESLAGAGSRPNEWTVVRLAGSGREVFRERAFYEGYERFMKVRDLLRHRYGDHFSDLLPTGRSKLYLGGDAISAFRIMGDPREPTCEEAPWLPPDHR